MEFVTYTYPMKMTHPYREPYTIQWMVFEMALANPSALRRPPGTSALRAMTLTSHRARSLGGWLGSSHPHLGPKAGCDMALRGPVTPSAPNSALPVPGRSQDFDATKERSWSRRWNAWKLSGPGAARPATTSTNGAHAGKGRAQVAEDWNLKLIEAQVECVVCQRMSYVHLEQF